jgi:hypothetical protein
MKLPLLRNNHLCLEDMFKCNYLFRGHVTKEQLKPVFMQPPLFRGQPELTITDISGTGRWNYLDLHKLKHRKVHEIHCQHYHYKMYKFFLVLEYLPIIQFQWEYEDCMFLILGGRWYMRTPNTPGLTFYALICPSPNSSTYLFQRD